MSLAGVVNPKPFLADLVGKSVVVKLKWGMEYKGESNGETCRFLASPFFGSACSQLHGLSGPWVFAGLLVSTDAYMNFQVG